MKNELANAFLDFVQDSPSCFHVTENFRRMLERAGFRELHEREAWKPERGGRYYVCRNHTSLLAFRIPEADPAGFMISASHSDSPTFKIKDNAEKLSAHCVQLNTEKYGGMLMSTWFDRPLSVAGRVMVKTASGAQERLVCIDRDLLIIPSVAIHQNRTANDGFKLLANVDTLPLYGMEDAKGSFLTMIAQAAGVQEDDILGTDLYLYVRGRGTVLGAQEEFLACPRLDDLECAYACMKGFLEAEPSEAISVCCVFDNEEVGSGTRQGAESDFLRDTLRRIALGLGLGEEDYLRLLSQSFQISADNAHAVHPNHPEYFDALNAPRMNGGVTVKFNADMRYTTDALSCAVLKCAAERAQVPLQVFANRSDLRGGTTLGGVSTTRVSIPSVDIGLAQLAMHSCYETGGVQDLEDLVKLMRTCYGCTFRTDGCGFTMA